MWSWRANHPLGGRNLYLRVQRPIFTASIIASKAAATLISPTISAVSSAGNNTSRASVQDVIDSFHFLFITSQTRDTQTKVLRFIVNATGNIQRRFMQKISKNDIC